MKTPRTTVFLIGDPAIVIEFGETCRNAGMSVVCKFNTPAPSPPYFKKSATIPRSVKFGVELTNIDRNVKKKNLLQLDKSLPSSKIILSSSVTTSVTEQSAWIRQPSRLIGISALPSLIANTLIEVAPSIHTSALTIKNAQDLLKTLGKEIAVIQDRVGMVMPRILCQLINEAFFALTEQIASPNDIDTAMKLGTGYPDGPIAWADRIGLDTVAAVLNAIQQDLGETRYRLAPLLRQMSVSKPWWNT